jgi:hypothetical protein
MHDIEIRVGSFHPFQFVMFDQAELLAVTYTRLGESQKTDEREKKMSN